MKASTKASSQYCLRECKVSVDGASELIDNREEFYRSAGALNAIWTRLDSICVFSPALYTDMASLHYRQVRYHTRHGRASELCQGSNVSSKTIMEYSVIDVKVGCGLDHDRNTFSWGN